MGKSLQLIVKTGDQEGAGTDANVYVVLEDENGLTTPRVKLDKIFYNDLERCKKDTYGMECPENFGKVVSMRLTRDDKGISDDWFCDYIHVEDRRVSKKRTTKTKSTKTYYNAPSLFETTSSQREMYFFPIHRWVEHSHEYIFREFAVCLPQEDPCPVPRRSDLEAKRRSYQYTVHSPGMVAQPRWSKSVVFTLGFQTSLQVYHRNVLPGFLSCASNIWWRDPIC